MKKRIWQLVVLGFVLGLMAGCNLVTYEEDDVLVLSTEGIDQFLIDHDEGDVTISGEDNLQEIEVSVMYSVLGEDIDEARFFKENHTQVHLEKIGSDAVLATAIKRGTQKEQGNIHLNIRMPKDVAVTYKQNEGELQMANLQNEMTIQHGSGNIQLVDLTGAIQLTDGAGQIAIERISGPLTIHNSSGTLTITNSKGEVMIVAGAGHVNVNDHEGLVSIRSGSGNINIQTVNGDVTILGNSSGTVNIENVSGIVTE